MYQTKITSQGTISIPAALRKKYDLKAGDVVTLEDNNGRMAIVKNTGFAELRAKNALFLKNAPATYKNGDGFAAHVSKKNQQ